jgi:hemerythrin-like domain-containing protein
MSQKHAPNIGQDLLRIHRVVTRGLAVARENSRTFIESGFPDDTTREGFWKYCQGLEATARGHHHTEDELIFPYLRERLPDADFDTLVAEHEAMEEILAKMQAAREAESLANMDRALAQMVDLWQPHINKEETVFSPEIVAEAMSVPEQIELTQKSAALGQEHTQPSPIAIPFLLYNLEGDDRAHFLAVMPPEVTQQLVPVVWKETWAPMTPFLLD